MKTSVDDVTRMLKELNNEISSLLSLVNFWKKSTIISGIVAFMTLIIFTSYLIYQYLFFDIIAKKKIVFIS
jgi:hypothetical protein